MKARRTRVQPGAKSTRRRGEHGQMVPIVAIFGVVLLASMALATDLSVATHFKRSLQNVTDSAALAGARYLPVTPALSDQEKATAAALAIVHNTYGWSTSGGADPTTLAQSGCGGAQCSVTVCAGLTTTTACTVTTTPAAGTSPFALTVNTPPIAPLVSTDVDTHHLQVIMHEQSNAFFANFVGVGSNHEGAQSVAYHFAPNQPFPFALYSNTVIGAGNQPEVITGNVYAARYMNPQDAASPICASGYIVLGAPQAPDSGYDGKGSNPGQYNNSNVNPKADPITNGVSVSTCSADNGIVGEATSPGNTAGCQAAYPGNNSSSVLTYDTTDAVCEANPGIAPPQVAAPPNIPVYGSTTCATAGLSSGTYQPGEYYCSSGGVSLTIDHPLAQGIYEIDPSPGSKGCDINIPKTSTVTDLTGVTFYLKGGAGICFLLPVGTTLTQTPYNAGTGLAGDDRYDVLSDGVGSPTITMSTVNLGGGNSVATWQLTGVIWLPTGTVNISNYNAIVDNGQIIVNSWNDTSGNHPNPSITYSAGNAPAQKELLQLSE